MAEVNDKRVIKTKSAIRDAFFDLVEEKGFEKVTVQMIADRAFIGKTTFYYHYEDKYDLAQKISEEFILTQRNELKERLRIFQKGTEDKAQVWQMFRETMLGHIRDYQLLRSLRIPDVDIDQSMREMIKETLVTMNYLKDDPDESGWVLVDLMMNYLNRFAADQNYMAPLDYVKTIHRYTDQYIKIFGDKDK